MSEDEPKQRGDIQKSEGNATSQFLEMSISDFREYLENFWKHNPNSIFVIEEPEDLSQPKKTYLHILEKDSRVKIVPKKKNE